MQAFAELLGLEPNAVRTMALAHVGYGFAQQAAVREIEAGLDERSGESVPVETRQQREEIEERRMVAASGLAIGASLYSMMYPCLARMLFRAAAHAYEELGLEYAAILALCGRDTEMVGRSWRRQRDSVDDEGGSMLARLLVVTARALEDPEANDAAARIFEQRAQFQGLPIGSAGIPASIYRQWAAELLRSTRSEPAPSRSTEVRRLFESFEERLQAARANAAQWQHLNSALLPVEPEILACALTVVRASRLRREPWESIVGSNLSRVARIPLEIGDEMDAGESLSGEEREVIATSEVLDTLWQRFA